MSLNFSEWYIVLGVTVAVIVILIFAMLALGMVFARFEVLPANAAETLNRVVLYLCLPAAVLMLYAGVRPQEVRRLRFRHLRLENGELIIPSTHSKTGGSRLVTLQPVALAAAIAWSRVYLGVHWPLDMVGGLLAGMCGCLGAALIWHTVGSALYRQLQRLYRLCFSLPIRKGWVRG